MIELSLDHAKALMSLFFQFFIIHFQLPLLHLQLPHPFLYHPQVFLLFLQLLLDSSSEDSSCCMVTFSFFDLVKRCEGALVEPSSSLSEFCSFCASVPLVGEPSGEVVVRWVIREDLRRVLWDEVELSCILVLHMMNWW